MCKSPDAPKLAKVTVKQTQAKEDKDLFDLKIPIGFGYNEKTGGETGESAVLKSFTMRVQEKEQSFYFPLESKPKFISFDVGNNYLKTVALEYPVPELKAQLQLDPDPTSRIYAAQALAKKGGLEAVKALAAALVNEPFWGVRSEVAKQLAEIKLDQAFDSLVSGLQDGDARVRRAVVEALAKINSYESYNLHSALQNV